MNFSKYLKNVQSFSKAKKTIPKKVLKCCSKAWSLEYAGITEAFTLSGKISTSHHVSDINAVRKRSKINVILSLCTKI